MDSIVITWREVLLLLVGVLAVYVAEMLLLLRRGSLPGWRFWQRGAEQQAQVRALMELRRDVEALQRDLAVLRVEGATTPLTKPAPAPGTELSVASAGRSSPAAPAVPAPNLPPGSAYAEAIRLARAGYPVTALVRDCGLSRGEADLIMALYGTPPA